MMIVGIGMNANTNQGAATMGHWMQAIIKDQSMSDAEFQEMLDDAHEQIDEQEYEDEPEKVECFE